MKAEIMSHLDLVPWYVFALYWAVTALRVKPTKTEEKSLDRLATLVLMCLAFVLLFYDLPRFALLQMRFMPMASWIARTGVLLTSLGVALAIWARHCLGMYWSARVTLKEGHRLIRSGPYRFVRHPIYTGMLLGAAGRALTVGEWRGVLAVALILAAHSRKAIREEKLLAAEFGEEYAIYRRNSGFLFPRLRFVAAMDTSAAGS